jgi:hypothetical protein
MISSVAAITDNPAFKKSDRDILRSPRSMAGNTGAKEKVPAAITCPVVTPANLPIG